MLCDSCNSAYHTFCVGLGRRVPEGDWYCPDCAVVHGGAAASHPQEDEAEEEEESSSDDARYIPLPSPNDK